MRTSVKRVPPETALERVLAALERELVEAPEAEILEAARELGMDPSMKGSAAFLGLRYPATPRLEDFFALADAQGWPVIGHLARARPGLPESEPPSPKPPRLPRPRKG
jgi:hypothetical protein